MYVSERRPARSDLIVLVAHNDDPTGESDSLFATNSGQYSLLVLEISIKPLLAVFVENKPVY